MELDVAFDPGDEGQPRVSLLDLPEEIQLKILHLLQPLDILALGRTCRSYSKYADNKQLWYVSKFLPCQTPEIVCRRCQWVLLSEEMPRFTFPPVSSLEQLGVLFKVRERQRTRFLFFVNFLISKFYFPKRIVAAEFGQFSLQREASTPSVYTAGCFSNSMSNSKCQKI